MSEKITHFFVSLKEPTNIDKSTKQYKNDKV